MSGWIVKVNNETPEHARFAMEDGFWDIRKYSTFRKMEPGDDVFFWITGNNSSSGLHGWGRVTQALQSLSDPTLTKARWVDVDTADYTHRFTFEPLASTPKWRPNWSEIQQLIEKNLASSAGGNPIVEDDKVARLRKLYQPGAAQGVDIDFTTNWSPSPLDDLPPYDAQPDEDTREFTKRSIANRRGSKKFRNALLAAYHQECAVTRSNATGALEAAHIDPYRGDRTDHVQNGLLLRADVHTLFDLHQLTIGDDYRIIVSPELESSTYRDLAGRQISLPDAKSQHPNQEALSRHRADCVWYSGH